MFVSTKTLQLACVVAIAAVASVDAHGYMALPKATFSGGGDPTQFIATMDGPSTLTAQAGQRFNQDPSSNAKAFTAAFKASSYKTLKALVDAKGSFISGASKECGLTSASGAKQPLPAQVEWAHSSSEGFTPSHEGPCEVWCDNQLVFSNDNCPKNYPSAPAKLPYDKSKCSGASMLKFYWIALHSSTWQVYLNCAPIQGGSGGGGGASPAVTPSTKPSNGTPTTSKPAKNTPTTKKPTNNKKTPKPETGADADEDCDELDIADEQTPMPTKKAGKATKATKAPAGKSRSIEYGFDELDEEN